MFQTHAADQFLWGMNSTTESYFDEAVQDVRSSFLLLEVAKNVGADFEEEKFTQLFAKYNNPREIVESDSSEDSHEPERVQSAELFGIFEDKKAKVEFFNKIVAQCARRELAQQGQIAQDRARLEAKILKDLRAQYNQEIAEYEKRFFAREFAKWNCLRLLEFYQAFKRSTKSAEWCKEARKLLSITNEYKSLYAGLQWWPNDRTKLSRENLHLMLYGTKQAPFTDMDKALVSDLVLPDITDDPKAYPSENAFIRRAVFEMLKKLIDENTPQSPDVSRVFADGTKIIKETLDGIFHAGWFDKFFGCVKDRAWYGKHTVEKMREPINLFGLPEFTTDQSRFEDARLMIFQEMKDEIGKLEKKNAT